MHFGVVHWAHLKIGVSLTGETRENGRLVGSQLSLLYLVSDHELISAGAQVANPGFNLVIVPVFR